MTVLDVIKRGEHHHGRGGASGGGAGATSMVPTPKEDVGYIVFGTIAGLWSFGFTLAEFFVGGEGVHH